MGTTNTNVRWKYYVLLYRLLLCVSRLAETHALKVSSQIAIYTRKPVVINCVKIGMGNPNYIDIS